MRDAPISLGNYRQNYMFYNKTDGKLLCSKIKTDLGVNKSIILIATTIATPIVSKINSELIENDLSIKLSVIFLSAAAVYCFARYICNRQYRKLNFSECFLSREDYTDFLNEAEKNTKTAITVFAVSVASSLLSFVAYLFTSRFIALFLGAGMFFVSCIMFRDNVTERRRIIRDLIEKTNSD